MATTTNIKFTKSSHNTQYISYDNLLEPFSDNFLSFLYLYIIHNIFSFLKIPNKKMFSRSNIDFIPFSTLVFVRVRSKRDTPATNPTSTQKGTATTQPYLLKYGDLNGQTYPSEPSTKSKHSLRKPNDCDLCLAEKFEITNYPGKNLLNKRSEIIAKCRHRRKLQLDIFEPPDGVQM